MLRPLKFLSIALAAFLLLAAILAFLAISPTPWVKNHQNLSQTDIQRAKQILQATASDSKSEKFKTIKLNENDLNIASNYLLNHLIKSSTRVKLNDDSLHFVISLSLPDKLFSSYLNISFNLSKLNSLPIITDLTIGRIGIANEFAGYMIESTIKHTALRQYYILASHHISTIQIQPGQLHITYLADFQDDADNPALTENKGYQSLLFYQRLINQTLLKHDPDWLLSLADLMKPLFTAAYHRSNENNVIDQNRAVILALSSYVNQEELRDYLPINLSTEKNYPVFLYRRIDMAKHFVASAALAASGAISLAHMLGQEKEISDSESGSGFSFIDLAGDRAGLRFGQAATASVRSARQLQEAMREINDYKAFMPEVRDLPERMNHEEFKRRYGSIYSPKYQEMLKLIDDRIAALPIYSQ